MDLDVLCNTLEYQMNKQASNTTVKMSDYMIEW